MMTAKIELAAPRFVAAVDDLITDRGPGGMGLVIFSSGAKQLMKVHEALLRCRTATFRR